MQVPTYPTYLKHVFFDAGKNDSQRKSAAKILFITDNVKSKSVITRFVVTFTTMASNAALPGREEHRLAQINAVSETFTICNT